MQLDDGFVDLVDRRRDGERDHPPLGRCRFEVRMGVHLLDDLASTRDVELECAVEVRPSVHLFWAHLTVHIHDEFLLAK